MRESRSSVRETLDSMDKEKRLSYIWDYYKLPIIAIAAVFVIGIYLLVLSMRPQTEYMLEISFLDERENVSEGSALYEQFEAYVKETPGADQIGSGEIHFDASYYFDLRNSSDFLGSYYQKLLVKIESGETDGMVGSYDNVLGIAQGGRVLDLRDERAGDILDRYADRVIYYETEEGETVPVAVDVTDSKVLAACTDYGEEVKLCFALSSQVTREEAAQLFLAFLLGE